MEHLGFAIAMDGDVSLIRVSGEIDAATAPELREAIVLAHQCTERDVTVDLAQVTFIDSSGIAALVDAHRGLEAMGHRLRIRNAQGHVERVLWIAGATEVVAPDLARL